jgi:hypothetical protein
VAALYASLAGVAAWAGEVLPAADIARRVSATGPALSFRARARLTETSADGGRRVYHLALVQKHGGGRTRLLWSVTGPAAARMRVLVEVRGDGGLSIWRAAGDGRAVRLSARQAAEPILGTRLRYEDLAAQYLDWPLQRASVTASGYVLESRASRGSAAVTSEVDGRTFVPMLTRKPPREFRCLGVRRQGRSHVCTGQEIRTAGEAGSTRIVMTGGALTTAIRETEFDLQASPTP